MAFKQERARMNSLLQELKAPSEVISKFDDLCRYRTNETAESLLRDACLQHGFVAPYVRDGQAIFLRPYSVGKQTPGYRLDGISNDPATEQGYRRGYDQGVAQVLQLLKAGRSAKEIKVFSEQVHEWRLQPIQAFGALPGTTLAQDLPHVDEF